jgi:hypothetical protein
MEGNRILARLLRVEAWYSKIVKSLGSLNNMWTVGLFAILHGLTALAERARKRVKKP